MLAAGAAVAIAVPSSALASSTGRATAPARQHTALAPIGIIDAFGAEQAPILAEMNVTGYRSIDGLRFWEGTIAGKPVVDVASGEVNESAELASYLLDKTFHPRATLFSGTAGAQNAKVHVGDVVVSGFAVDKETIHYHLGGWQDGYSGEEINLTKQSDVRGDIISGYGTPLPTPADAKTYGYGSGTDKRAVYVEAYSAPYQLVTTATAASHLVGSTAISDATGDPSRTGSITNKVVAGVVGGADVWTEPLSWIEAQNMLYPTDAEENEANGFAFMNSQLGVPWLLVRGISDTVWYPNAYDGILASQHAAIVVRYLVQHLPATIDKAPTRLSGLWKQSNARMYGYIVAKRAFYRVTPVSKVKYVNSKGQTVVVTGTELKNREAEYTYAAGKI
jgi:adenosylhomocysteine nucleosidase